MNICNRLVIWYIWWAWAACAPLGFIGTPSYFRVGDFFPCSEQVIEGLILVRGLPFVYLCECVNMCNSALVTSNNIE